MGPTVPVEIPASCSSLVKKFVASDEQLAGISTRVPWVQWDSPEIEMHNPFA